MKKFKINITIAALCALVLLLFAALAGYSALPKQSAEAVSVQISQMPEDLKGLFTDYTRTQLSPGYADSAALDELNQKYSGTVGWSAIYSRAQDVLYGRVHFEPDREFSTEEGAANRIYKSGNASTYSKDVLKWNYRASDLQITGIYGTAQTQFTVYVEAADGVRLPEIVMTSHHASYRNYRDTAQLYKDASTFWYSFGGSAAGPVYIRYPYTEEEQAGDVKIYIEGGQKYPVFKKGGDVTAFLGMLKEYEEGRSLYGYPNLAELQTDYAFFTTTSSSLYDTYIKYNTIDPQTNLELWGDLFKRVYEFNGIATDENSPYGKNYDNRTTWARLNFRYMQAVPNSGAYATDYHIGFYTEHYWFANFYNYLTPVGTHTTQDYSMFAMGHEMGHMLDTGGRTVNETTNNVTATFVYSKALGKKEKQEYQPYEKSLNKLARDASVDYTAYDDGKILYKTGDYDHNYMMWWFLESSFPGYWGKLNNMYRYYTDEAPSDSAEKMVYFSSLVTGVDLGSYFGRWGLYIGYSGKFSVNNASLQYSELMEAAIKAGKVYRRFNRYYYSDEVQYDYITAHPQATEYLGQTPNVSVKRGTGEYIIAISGKADPALLGYEVLVSTDGQNYSVAGFTRSVQFKDTFDYQTEPTYKVVAVNRYFAVSGQSLPAKAGEEQPSGGVCMVNGQYYNTLSDGLKNASEGDTVWLFGDCSLGTQAINKNITISPDKSVGEVRISVSGSMYMMQIGADVALRGREDARIIIDGGSIPRTYPPIYGGSGSFTAEYVNFENHSASFGGGVFFALSAKAVFRNCTFINCSSADGAVAAVKTSPVTVDGCIFDCDGPHFLLTDDSQLVFENNISPVELNVKGTPSVRAAGFTPSPDDLAKIVLNDGLTAMTGDGDGIVFGVSTHTLTFLVDGVEHSLTASGFYVFGGENFAPQNCYIAEYADQSGGHIYHVGDRAEVTEDMTFVCTVKQNVPVTFWYMDGPKTSYARQEGSIYLPKSDGKRDISCWTDRDGKLYPAGGSAPASEGEFIPKYNGYFRYDFLDGGAYCGGGFAAYGQKVDLPLPQGEGFKGWQCQGKLYSGQAEIVCDALFTAVYGQMYDLTLAQIVFEETPVYDGSMQCPAFSVLINGQTVPKEYYKTTWLNNVQAGEGRLVIEGTDLACGTKEAAFTILPRSLTAEDITAVFDGEAVYNGSRIELAPKISLGGSLLGAESYTLEYPADCTNAGRVEVTVTFRGNYTGSAVTGYTIQRANSPASLGELQAGGAKTVGDIPLPQNWEWEDPLASVQGNGYMYAFAKYVGADAANYVNVRAQVKIILPEPNPEPDPEPQPEPEPEPNSVGCGGCGSTGIGGGFAAGGGAALIIAVMLTVYTSKARKKH